MPSIFTRIIAGEIPGAFVFRDPLWVAFLDHAPVAPGHLLLVPRAEVQYLADLPADAKAALGDYLGRSITALKRATGCAAVNVLVNDGPEAGQLVPHAHLHLIPRTAGDGIRYHLPAGGRSPDLAAMAARVRAEWR